MVQARKGKSKHFEMHSDTFYNKDLVSMKKFLKCTYLKATEGRRQSLRLSPLYHFSMSPKEMRRQN